MKNNFATQVRKLARKVTLLVEEKKKYGRHREACEVIERKNNNSLGRKNNSFRRKKKEWADKESELPR